MGNFAFMHGFEDIKPGARLRGLDPGGIAVVVQIARFGPDALNLALLQQKEIKAHESCWKQQGTLVRTIQKVRADLVLEIERIIGIAEEEE